MVNRGIQLIALILVLKICIEKQLQVSEMKWDITRSICAVLKNCYDGKISYLSTLSRVTHLVRNQQTNVEKNWF